MLKKIAWIALGLVVLAILIAVVWVLTLRPRIESRLAAIRAAGEPVTPEELDAFYREPEGENAADRFLAAFAQFPEGDGDDERPPHIPKEAYLNPRAPLPPETLAEIRAWLAERAEAQRLLHEAVAIDECKFDLDFSQGLDVSYDHLGQLSLSSRTLILDAVERLSRGDGDGAADSLWAALRCGYAMRHEPTLLSGLVRLACGSRAVWHIERWAGAHDPTPGACKRLEAALRDEADSRMIHRMYVGERCIGIHVFETMVLARSAAPAAFLYKPDFIYYLDLMNGIVATTGLPYPESLRRGAAWSEPVIPFYATVTGMILPGLARVSEETRRHMVRTESARVGLAALRFRAARGALPNALSDLVPDFIDAVPVDLYDSKPMRYRKTSDGFAVYAVSGNQVDDGGKTDRDEKTDTYLDIGFRVRGQGPR